MSHGVFINFKISLEKMIPNTIRQKLNSVIKMIEVNIDVFTFSIYFPPKYWEITTPHPIPHPFAIVISTNVIGYDAPTAARGVVGEC